MKLRTILLILGLLAFLSVVASGLLYYSSLQASALHNAETNAVHHTEKIKSLISSYLADNQKAVRALAGLKELQKALTDPNESNLSEANLLLDHFNDSLKVSVSYLMDRNGKTIASSNRHDKRSFVGKNYSFRPYFKEAIHKKPSVYMALGVTSKKRGVYYSHPVYSSTPGTPIGVVVLKSGVDKIEREFINFENYRKEMMTFITGTHGIVFMSDHKDFLYRLLWQVSDEKSVKVLNTKQFGKGPWDWAGFKRKNKNRVVDKVGNEYLMFQKPIESLSGWNVVHLHNIRMLSKAIAAPFIGTTGYIILVLCVLIGLSVFILYNIGKSDIIKRLDAEKALREREAFINAVLDNLPIGVAVNSVDLTVEFEYMNDNFSKFYRTTREALADPDAFWNAAYEDPEFREKMKKRVLDDCASGDPERMYWPNVPIARKGAETSFITARNTPVPDKQLMISTVWDVTEAMQAKKNLMKNQYYLTKAQEIGKIGTWELDIQKNILIWTDENYKIFGVPIGTELNYEIFLNCVHPDDRDYVNKKWSAALNNEPYDIVHRLIVDDKVKWVREKADIEFDKDCKPIIAIGFTQDLTDLKQIEGALYESEDKFKTLYDNAPLSYQSLDENGNFIEVNETWLNILGYKREEVIGKNFGEFLHPDWKDHFKENFPRFKAIGEILGVEFEMVKKDGSLILVSYHGKIEHHQDGSFKQTHCIFRNITDQKRVEKEKEKLESQLQQAQKMESIGTLAGGIAHDFNNILFPIIGLSELLLEDLPRGSVKHENVQEIFKAGKRGADLVKQILTFSRQSEHRMIPIRVQQILKEAITLCRATIPSNIEINQDIQMDCGLAMADPIQIHQVAMNLITNAYHAVEKEVGKISVELKEKTIGENDLSDSTLEPGRYAMLSVSDTGGGIDPAVLDKIFDPYFTTKKQGKGTGLGLSVVYGIVEEHKGYINVNSEVGKGTTFHVYLPLMEKPTEYLSVEKVEKYSTGNERILLVDDEESIVQMLSQSLERLGYMVTCHNSSNDALNRFKANPDDFDLVVTDMTMPNMTGDQLAKEVMSIKLSIPVIICTGFSERINQEKAEAVGIKGFLMKPVVMSEMAQMIRKVLDEAKDLD